MQKDALEAFKDAGIWPGFPAIPCFEVLQIGLFKTAILFNHKGKKNNMESDIKKKVWVYDVDYVPGEKHTAVRMWAVSETGETVILIDRSFRPYFYVELASQWKSRERTTDAMQMIRGLNGLLGNIITKVETVKKRLLGEEREFIKITVQKPEDVVRVWEIIKKWPSVLNQYEYSIPFRKRYIIDNDIPMSEWIVAEGKDETRKTSPADAEISISSILRTDSSFPLPQLREIAVYAEVLRGEIIMIALSGPSGYRKVLTHGESPLKSDDFSVEVMATERDMIERFAHIIAERDPHIIYTFNGDKKDIKALYERAEKLGADLSLGRDGSGVSFFKKGKSVAAMMHGRVHIDLQAFASNIRSRMMYFETSGLETVAEKVIESMSCPAKGDAREWECLEWREIEAIWNGRSSIDRLMRHAARRADLVLSLSESVKNLIFHFSNICRQTIFDVSRMYPSQMIDWVLVREAHRLSEMILNPPTQTEIRQRYSAEPYEGGYVHEVSEGIYKGVFSFEIQNFYPAIAVRHNISPETLDVDEAYAEGNRVPESEHFFSKKKRGFVPAVIMHAQEERRKIEERKREAEGEEKAFLQAREDALELLANSVYGYFAYPGSRWYSRICASSIAAWGREYMKRAISAIKEKGFGVIYAETYILFAKGSRWALGKAEERIRQHLPQSAGIKSSFYKAAIFAKGAGEKARYALLDSENRLLIKGFEAVRKDWSNIAKETQEMVLLALLRDGSSKKAEKVIKDAIVRLKTGDVDLEDLVMRNQITKPLEKYEQAWPHISAAKKLAERGGNVLPGFEISYIITEGDGSISERAEPFGYAESYDEEYYIRNQIAGALSKICAIAGINLQRITEEVEKEEDQNVLKDYFRKSFREKVRERFGF